MKLACFAVLTLSAAAQNFDERGFLEIYSTFYPQKAPNDSGRAVSEALLRYEASWEPLQWLKVAAAFDARVDTHHQVDRAWHQSVDDRAIQRPAFSIRRMSATLHKGKFTLEAGRQFIRWGKADILNPTDRFAPKDFLNVVNTDFLGVIASRLTYESGSNTVELVWQPWFTPARTPLLRQRWTVLPPAVAALPIRDAGARYPGRSQFGARWNHIARGYEYSFSYFDGFNYLPLFDASLNVQRYYPKLRLIGADGAFPLRWLTVKGEAAYYMSPRHQTDEYLLYVVQLERQQGEWVFVGGYSGVVVTDAIGNPLQFSPERGFARSFLGRASYTISPTKDVAVEGTTRQNGAGTWLRVAYSQTFGRHWRTTAGFTWIRGEANDFLGQYHRNSHASLILRYSF